MTFPPEVWSGVLRRLEETLPDFTFEAWVAPLAMGATGSNRVCVLCPSPFHRDRVNNSLREPITRAFQDELGEKPSIDFDVADASVLEASAKSSPSSLDRPNRPSAASHPARPAFTETGETDAATVPTPQAQPQAQQQKQTGRRGPDAAGKAPKRTAGHRTPAALRAAMPNPVGEPTEAATGPLAAAIGRATSGLKIDLTGRSAAPTPAPTTSGNGNGAPAAMRGPGVAPARRMARSGDAPSNRQQGSSIDTPFDAPALRPSGVPGSGGGASARPAAPSRTRMQGRSDAAASAQAFDQPELPWSFENFVVGPCNALAREAAFAVAGGQTLALNQLYIASAPGLGKTHLARAAATSVARENRRPVRYASAEVFTSEFVAALRNKRTPEFKRRYRPDRGGLLVLEDVQFLAAKQATQLEFFHSVQHVLDGGGRVLITGDRMPQEMTDLDDRVREQLAAGFVAGLEAPDVSVRRQILKVKAARGGIALPDECIDLLVESVQGNVRELEGVLTQVVTTATLLKRPIDLALTRRAVAQKIAPVTTEVKRPRINDVLAVVASFFQTSPDQLAARTRRRSVLVPRQLAMYLCHRHTEAPLAEIGRALGRDHPSVRNAIKKVEREMLENPKLRYQVEALTTAIQERMG